VDSFFDVFFDITFQQSDMRLPPTDQLPRPQRPFPQDIELPPPPAIVCIRERRGVEVFVWYCFLGWRSDCVLIKVGEQCICFHVDP
jgi:hypothetical protein